MQDHIGVERDSDRAADDREARLEGELPGEVIRKVPGGFRLFSVSTGKPLGPVRATREEAYRRDEERVNFFKNLARSTGGPGSLKAKYEAYQREGGK